MKDQRVAFIECEADDFADENPMIATVELIALDAFELSNRTVNQWQFVLTDRIRHLAELVTGRRRKSITQQLLFMG